MVPGEGAVIPSRSSVAIQVEGTSRRCIRKMQVPPTNPALSDESLAKLRHVRQVIWKSGVSGGVLGMLGGVAAWPMLKSLEKRGKLNGVVLEGRHRTGLVLGLGTVMMIVASIAAGNLITQ